MTDYEEFNDYYNYINNNWFKTFNLPDEYSKFSTFNIVSEKIDKQINQIINSISSMDNSYLSSNEILIKNLYNKLNNNYQRNNEDIMPLNKIFNEIDKIQSWNDLSKIIGFLTIFDMGVFLNIYISLDLKSNNKYLLHINELNLFLPSKDYYQDNKYKDIQIDYILFIKKVLKYLKLDIAKLPNIEDNLSERIFIFEKMISANQYNNEIKRDLEYLYNPISFSNLQELLGNNINLNSIFFWIKKLKPNIESYYDKIIYYNSNYFKQLNNIFEEFGIEFIKLYLKYNIFVKSSNVLSDNIYDIYFDFFGKKISGIKNRISDKKRNLDILSNNLGEIIGDIYIKKYYNSNTSNLILDLFNKIKDSSIEIINKSSWMNDKTKKKAINKINKIKILIGYSKIIRDYSPLIDDKISKLNLYELIKSYSVYYFKYNLDKLDKKPDDEEWHMNVYETNAYYNPLNNQIVLPAGILQEPFFSENYTFENNLGGIGTIIAHEISHAFDDQGRKFDADGNLKTWWYPSDINNYNKKVEPIIEQFNSVKLFDINISGKMTLGENIADYTAVIIITNILNSLNVDKKKYKDMYRAYANIWKQKIRKNELIKRLNTDVHAPGRYRTNQILSNIPEFINIYNIKEGNKMYIPEDKKIKLWN